MPPFPSTISTNDDTHSSHQQSKSNIKFASVNKSSLTDATKIKFGLSDEETVTLNEQQQQRTRTSDIREFLLRAIGAIRTSMRVGDTEIVYESDDDGSIPEEDDDG